MTSTAATAAARPAAPGTYNRMFYSGTALTMAGHRLHRIRADVLSAQLLRRTGLRYRHDSHVAARTDAWFRVHGMGAAFVIQTSLVASRNVAMHRRMGIAGAVLAASMVAVGLPTAFAAAARGSTVPGIEPLVFLVVPVFDMVLFAGFVTAAVLRRREKEAHSGSCSSPTPQ